MPLKGSPRWEDPESVFSDSSVHLPVLPRPHRSRPLAHCQSMGRRKKLRPGEVLPRVWPGREYTGLAVVLSDPALVSL